MSPTVLLLRSIEYVRLASLGHILSPESRVMISQTDNQEYVRTLGFRSKE